MTITRRTFIKNIARSVIGLFGVSGFSYYYARYLEPEMLTVNHHSIHHPSIPDAFESFKIVQFSDTHIGFHYDLKQLQRTVQTINQQKPDLIVFTGDLVDKPHTYPFDSNLPSLLNKLQAPYGKYWIYGNHDHGGYGTEKIHQVMRDGGFTLLQNNHARIYRGGSEFVLVGLDDVMLGQPNLPKALIDVAPSLFTILMVHEPDGADHYKSYPVDIQLSGHSHGGQIQLPLFGYLVTPPMAEKYVEGHYKLDSLDLFVSRGLGTTRLPYRFLCRPEISVFHLQLAKV